MDLQLVVLATPISEVMRRIADISPAKLVHRRGVASPEAPRGTLNFPTGVLEDTGHRFRIDPLLIRECESKAPKMEPDGERFHGERMIIDAVNDKAFYLVWDTEEARKIIADEAVLFEEDLADPYRPTPSFVQRPVPAPANPYRALTAIIPPVIADPRRTGPVSFQHNASGMVVALSSITGQIVRTYIQKSEPTKVNSSTKGSALAKWCQTVTGDEFFAFWGQEAPRNFRPQRNVLFNNPLIALRTADESDGPVNISEFFSLEVLAYHGGVDNLPPYLLRWFWEPYLELFNVGRNGASTRRRGLHIVSGCSEVPRSRGPQVISLSQSSNRVSLPSGSLNRSGPSLHARSEPSSLTKSNPGIFIPTSASCPDVQRLSLGSSIPSATLSTTSTDSVSSGKKECKVVRVGKKKSICRVCLARGPMIPSHLLSPISEPGVGSALHPKDVDCPGPLDVWEQYREHEDCDSSRQRNIFRLYGPPCVLPLIEMYNPVGWRTVLDPAWLPGVEEELYVDSFENDNWEFPLYEAKTLATVPDSAFLEEVVLNGYFVAKRFKAGVYSEGKFRSRKMLLQASVISPSLLLVLGRDKYLRRIESTANPSSTLYPFECLVVNTTTGHRFVFPQFGSDMPEGTNQNIRIWFLLCRARYEVLNSWVSGMLPDIVRRDSTRMEVLQRLGVALTPEQLTFWIYFRSFSEKIAEWIQADFIHREGASRTSMERRIHSISHDYLAETDKYLRNSFGLVEFTPLSSVVIV